MSDLKVGQIPDALRDMVGAAVSEQVKEAMAKSAEGRASGIVSAASQPQASAAGLEKNKFGRFVRCMAMGMNGNGMDMGRSAAVAKAMGDFEVSKALGEAALSTGGAIVPPGFVNEVIEVLRSKAVVRGLGCREVPMPNGNLTLPYGSGGATSYFVGENTNATISAETFGQLKMSAHKLMTIVPISNELLQDAGPVADQFVQDDMAMAMAAREDLSYIRDNGTSNTLAGLASLVDSTHKFDITHAGAEATLQEIVFDLGKMVRLLQQDNVQITKGAWLFAPRTYWHLRTLQTSLGTYAFQAEMLNGTLWGFPFGVTSQIPITLNTSGAGTSDESEVYFFDADKILLGRTNDMQIETFRGAAYHNGSTVISGVSQDQTVAVASMRIDIASRFRGLDISMLTSVDWGPTT